MESIARSAGFCLLRPQYSHQQRCRLHFMSRAHRPDAADNADGINGNEMVPGLPSRSAASSAAQRQDIRDAWQRHTIQGRPAFAKQKLSSAEQRAHDELFYLSPLK